MLVAAQALSLARVDLSLLAPKPQRLRRDAELDRDLPHRSAARVDQGDRVTPKRSGYGLVYCLRFDINTILPPDPDGPSAQVSTKAGELQTIKQPTEQPS